MRTHFADFEDGNDSDKEDSENSAHSTSSSSDTSSSSSSSSSSSASSTSSRSSNSNMEASSSSDGNKDSDNIHLENMSHYANLLELILATHVLNPTNVPKCSQLYLVLVEYKEDDPKCFRRNLRVSPSTFDALVVCLEDHPIFHNKSHTAQQYPIEIQLVIVPFRFGHDGNAASVKSSAQWAGVSVGMVVKVTRRVIIASLALHDEVIHWPSAAEKEVAKEWVEANLCPVWRDGFCMVYFNLDPLV